MATLEAYLTAKAKMDEARKEIAATARQAFEGGAKTLLEQHPIVKSFGWSQYTPYFNDGDSCEFSAHTDSPYINFTSDEDGDCDEEWCGDWRARQKQKAGEPLTEEEAAGLAVIEYLGVFDEDSYEIMFDDHVKVTVSRDGIEVKEYSHD